MRLQTFRGTLDGTRRRWEEEMMNFMLRYKLQ
jgi:hypothetical protein